MLYNPYEDYMRNSLGYNVNPLMEMEAGYETEGYTTYNGANVDDMYPEIYKTVYPMVCHACMNVQENISEDLVSRITDEIYRNVEGMETVQENRSTGVNISISGNRTVKSDSVSSTRSNNMPMNTASNTRQENRQRNPFLRDLIRILVLRELLGNPVRPRPPRPRPPMPPRPPYRPSYDEDFRPNQRPEPPRPGTGPRPEPRSPYAF